MNVTSLLAGFSPLYPGLFGRSIAALRGPVLEHAAWARSRPSDGAQSPVDDDSLADSVELSDAALAAQAGDPSLAEIEEAPSASQVAATGDATVLPVDQATGRDSSTPDSDAGSQATASSDGNDTTAAQTAADSELTPEERHQVDELRRRDAEVRQHEQAHLAAAGAHARGGPTYEYQTRPDGRRYAVGGEVQIDTSPEETPEATIAKMEQVRAAAQAPAEPSSQDQAVAAKASAEIQKARAEQAQGEREEEEPAGRHSNGIEADEPRRGGRARDADIARGPYRRESDHSRKAAQTREWYA